MGECSKFGDFTFSRFGFIVRTDRQRDAAKRFTAATVVAVASQLQVWAEILETMQHESPELKSGFHYPSWRPELTRLVETRYRQHGPCWRVMETGHPSTRAVNSGRQLGWWKPGLTDIISTSSTADHAHRSSYDCTWRTQMDFRHEWRSTLSSRLVRKYKLLYKPLALSIGNGKFRPPRSRKPFNRFWRNFKLRTTSRRPPGMQDHISLRQRGWSGWTPSLPL